MAGKYVELNPAFRDYKERTLRVADILQNLRKENEICALKGWRDEVMLVVHNFCRGIPLLGPTHSMYLIF